MHNMMNLKSSASPAGLYGISSVSDVFRCVSTAGQSRWIAQSEIQESGMWRKEGRSVLRSSEGCCVSGRVNDRLESPLL